MHSKALIALAAAGLVGEALAASHHRHIFQHKHQKKAVVTDVVTVVDWVYVTVTDGETSTAADVFYTDRKHPEIPLTTSKSTSSTSSSTSSSSSSSSTSSSSTSSSTSSSVVPTTIVTQVKPTSTSSAVQNTPPAAVAVAVHSSSSAAAAVNVAVNTPAVVVPVVASSTHAAPPPPPPPAPSSTHAAAAASTPAVASTNTGGSSVAVSTGKRGLAYNDGSLLSRFLGSGTKVSWAYNWGQSDDSGVAVEFVPMLWGLKDNFPTSWPANAQKAIDAGSKCLLSFNEPDYPTQSNLSPQEASEQHISLMNPFSGKARIGSPAITNAIGDGVGIDWMSKFFTACNGKCAVDFVVVHIYGVDTNTFLQHLLDVWKAFKKPVWITEFAFSGSDDQINSQLETVINQIETNPTYSFVERFSYFMVADGSLAQGGSLSSYGKTFAYGA